jgi:hypothetical protein
VVQGVGPELLGKPQYRKKKKKGKHANRKKSGTKAKYYMILFI